MGVVIFGVGLILGLAFLIVFFVELCTEGRKKTGAVVRVDTEPNRPEANVSEGARFTRRIFSAEESYRLPAIRHRRRA